jgi:hypothetical protein
MTPPIGSKLRHYAAPTAAMLAGVLASEPLVIAFTTGVFVTLWFESNRQDRPGGQLEADHRNEEAEP